MLKTLDLKLDRAARASLAEQIRAGITAAIASGVLAPGARLPSWLDLAAQLGVARGTVKAAYERLADEQLVVASGPAGTRVAERPARIPVPKASLDRDSPAAPGERPRSPTPALFQTGVPAPDCLPVALLARLRASAARAEMAPSSLHRDPRGEPDLKQEIAAHLAHSRGIECRLSQIFVTAGFTAALGVVLRMLRAEGGAAWVEDPGFPPSRRALAISQLRPVAIPVDDSGMDVSSAMEHAPDAALALVTPGQQAPLGSTLSLPRRLQLLEWAERTGAWVIEDDYLGGLQLKRRAAPALASLDRAGRVIHVGSFSKTISPALRLGFIVAPVALVPVLEEAAACLAPAPDAAVQLSTAQFMRDGHYTRHLRRLKRVYAARSQALQVALEARGLPARPAGLAVLLPLPEGVSDHAIATEAQIYGLAPSPLSAWHADHGPGLRQAGLLLGVATAMEDRLAGACDHLQQIISQLT
jgi:GntR family transcriptional regulator/MocR family aminotransferase